MCVRGTTVQCIACELIYLWDIIGILVLPALFQVAILILFQSLAVFVLLVSYSIALTKLLCSQEQPLRPPRTPELETKQR
jgi:hypothetical protein